MSQDGSNPSLRTHILRGGMYLGVRQLLGIAINVTGMLLLTKVVGPAEYGRYAAALGVFLTLQFLTQIGIAVYLVRSEQTPAREVLDVAATLFALLGVIGLGVGALLAPWFDHWTRIDSVASVMLALLIALPLLNVGQVALAQLDRALAFKRIAWIELTAQLIFFAIAVPLAFRGFGAWAAVAGWWAQQLILVTGYSLSARYFPRLLWRKHHVRDMLAYGFPFSAAIWIYQLRRLVNPLVVGRYLGAEAVGIVSLCTQLVTHLGFAGVIAWRISTASLARVQHDKQRLLRAISEGMWLQSLAVGPPLVLFAWFAPQLVPLLLGKSWSQLSTIYPFIALVYLINTLFILHSSALSVLRQNVQLGVVHLVQLVALAGGAAVLVPRLGLIGYAWAEVATVLSYPLMHYFIAQRVGRPAHVRVIPVAGAFSLALFFGQIGWVSLLGLVALLLIAPFWPETRQLLADLRAATAES